MRNVTERLNQYLRTDTMEKVKRKYLELILGAVLLIPPILSVFALLFLYLGVDILKPMFLTEGAITPTALVGRYTDSGGFTPALPFYLGLMAIAGAYLISHSTVNNIKQ